MPISFASEFGTKEMSKTFYHDPSSNRSKGLQSKQVTNSNFFPAVDQPQVRYTTAMPMDASFSRTASGFSPQNMND